MTIKQTLAHAAEQFRELDSPTLEARLLLSYTLEKPQTYLFTSENKSLADKTLSTFLTLIKKRKQREPLAYLTHHKEFWGLDFYA